MAVPGTYRMAVEVTPLDVPGDTPMGGYGWGDDRRTDGSAGNKLKVRCAIIVSPQGQRIALVQVDVISIPRPVYERIRDGIIRAGVVSEAKNLVLAQSHTHNGPMVGAKPDGYVLLDSQPAFNATQAYTDRFVEQIVSVARAANGQPLTEVTLQYAEGFGEVGANRCDLPWTPREVPVLVARRTDNCDLFAVLTGHACHPVSCYRATSFRTQSSDYANR